MPTVSSVATAAQFLTSGHAALIGRTLRREAVVETLQTATMMRRAIVAPAWDYVVAVERSWVATARDTIRIRSLQDPELCGVDLAFDRSYLFLTFAFDGWRGGTSQCLPPLRPEAVPEIIARLDSARRH